MELIDNIDYLIEFDIDESIEIDLEEWTEDEVVIKRRIFTLEYSRPVMDDIYVYMFKAKYPVDNCILDNITIFRSPTECYILYNPYAKTFQYYFECLKLSLLLYEYDAIKINLNISELVYAKRARSRK